MMLSHPVLLGLLWSLLFLVSSGQPQISNKETNKVYTYTYHFTHNGTTNSKEILQSVLGGDPDFGIDSPDGKSIVKTFSNPNIRGFYIRGVLPAGPVARNGNTGYNAPFNTNRAIDGIKQIVQNNLQPPNNIATGLLPVSPNIEKEFPGDFNNLNYLGRNFQNTDDFPKIPPPPPPEIDNNVITRVQNFARDTPDGGRVVGKVETFAYNPPPVINSVSRSQENSQGYRHNENYVNNNQGRSGFRTQSYFRQHFRTVTPNLDTNNFQDNSVDNRNAGIGINNNNQWWNSVNDNRQNRALNQEIKQNVQNIQNNVQNQFNSAFGRRLNTANRAQNNLNTNNQNFRNNNQNRIYSNHHFNQINNNQNNQGNHYANNNPQNNNLHNNPPNNNLYNNQQNNHAYNNQRTNTLGNNYNQFNDDTAKNVLNLINNVNNRLSNINDIGLTWDDEINPNVNNDWSRRSPNSNGRPFSNAHSGPLSNPVDSKPVDLIKTTLQALVGGRELHIPNISEIGDQGNSYRNVGGGGTEKFFGVDRISEGPNSFSRNQQRGYQRNFEVNSNRGYQRSNQWSSNTLRRLDAQGTKPNFSKDFIDVFNDDH